MKGKKVALSLQQRAAKVVWPKPDDNAGSFLQFKHELKVLVFENIVLPSGSTTDAIKSWDYDEDNEEFYFKVSDALMLETRSASGAVAITRRCGIETMFVLPRTALTELELAIEMLNQEIQEWRKSLYHVRKLQLQHILATEGQEAFLAATDRGF